MKRIKLDIATSGADAGEADAASDPLGGEKFVFGTSEVTGEQLEAARRFREERLYSIYSQPSGGLKQRPCEAVWSDDEAAARVTQARGKHLRVMGETREGGHTWLLAEETLWLVESGNLLLEHEGVRVSGEWLQRRLFCERPHRLTMQHQSLYNYLRRLGCVVRRSPLSVPERWVRGGAAAPAVEAAAARVEEAAAPLVADVGAFVHADVYRLLQVVKHKAPEAAADDEQAPQWLIFDVWRAEGSSKNWSRNRPPPVTWRVITVPISPGITVPPVNALRALHERLHVDNAQVMMALVDVRGDKPVFMCLGPEEIPANELLTKRTN